MDIGTIASAAVMMKAAQAQQTVGTAIIKQAAEQQAMIANMLAQNVQQSQQSSSDNGSGISIYA